MLLKTIGKDRRCKLTDTQIRMIKRAYRLEIWTMKGLASLFNVSHQRISQIIDRNGTIEGVRKAEARKNKRRYKVDAKYRAKVSEIKREYYIYKTKVMKKYERKQA